MNAIWILPRISTEVSISSVDNVLMEPEKSWKKLFDIELLMAVHEKVNMLYSCTVLNVHGEIFAVFFIIIFSLNDIQQFNVFGQVILDDSLT